MKPMNSLVALGAAAVLMGSGLIATPASAAAASVQDELAKNGGTIEIVAAGESKTLEISPRKVEAQKKTPVPYCSYKAKNQTKVRTYFRAGVSGFGGSSAYLRCGKYDNDKTKRPGWGLRHIGERHKTDWANKAGGSDWFDMMEFATKATLKKPESAVRQANDNYKYCAPVELKYKGKVYDRFKTVSPVSHQGKNVISSYPAKKC